MSADYNSGHFSWEEVPAAVKSDKFRTQGRGKPDWTAEKRRILIKGIAEALYNTEPETNELFDNRDFILQFAVQAEYRILLKKDSLMMYSLTMHHYAEEISSRKITIHFMEVNGSVLYIETRNKQVTQRALPPTKYL